MIRIKIANKKSTLTATVIQNYIKSEEEIARKSVSYSRSGSSYTSTPYTHLYAYANRSYNQFTCQDGFTVFFYEWSDLSREPRKFKTKTAFFQFVQDCNIEIDPDSQNRLEMGTYALFASCVKGTNKLIIQYTFVALVNAWGTASYNPPAKTQTQSKMTEILARDFIDFNFYECSDITRQPLHFSSWKKWIEFMTKYGLKMSSHNEKRLKALSNKKHYGACITGYNIVAARSELDKLELALRSAVQVLDR